jgi:hypothetical protein
VTEASNRNRFNISANGDFSRVPEISNDGIAPKIHQKVFRNPEKWILSVNSDTPDSGVRKCQTSNLGKTGWNTNGLQIHARWKAEAGKGVK